ncbi:hypothetical protein [Hydrogenimonas sp.]
MRIVWTFLAAMLMFEGCFDSGSEGAKKPDFMAKVGALQEGSLAALALDGAIGAIPIKALNAGSEIDETAREESGGKIAIESLEPLKKEDILLLTKGFVLAVVREKSGPRLWALTLTPEGKPIEMVLLHMQMGNNEFKISRSYDYFGDIPYRFDPKTRRFELTDLRYDTEWITPTKGKDVVAYRTKLVVEVEGDGRFKVVEKRELPHRLEK